MGVGEQLCPLPHEVVFLPAREDLEVVEGVAVVEEVAKIMSDRLAAEVAGREAAVEEVASMVGVARMVGLTGVV